MVFYPYFSIVSGHTRKTWERTANVECQYTRVELTVSIRKPVISLPVLSSHPLPSSFLLAPLSLRFHNTVVSQRQIPQT